MNAKKTAFHNPSPDGNLPKNASGDDVRKEFAKRLNAEMTAQGINQSELARRASKYMESGKFGRDSVSGYVRGVNLPGPVHLSALSQALHVKPSDLVPSRLIPNVDNTRPQCDVKETGDGRARLRINQEVPWPVALEVMKLLKGAE